MRMLFVVMALVLAWGPMGHGAAAAVVGRLTQVDGRVDLLKGGSPPAVGLKVGDSVETGDVVRSKSLSKAQITFMDNSIITLAPETRLAIDDYRYDPAQGKRRAVLELFQGLAHVLVNKIFKVEEPDFIIKTHTAVTGVRGTDFGIRLQPNSSTILNFEGRTRVGSTFPELGAWLKRARTIAYQHDANRPFFSPGSFVDLGNMQSTMVQRGFLPTMPMPISPQDQQVFMNQMVSGLQGKRNPGGSSGAGGGNPGPMDGGAGTAGTSSTVPAGTTLGLIAGTGNTTLAVLTAVTVPPTVTPTSSTFNFTQQYYAAWLQIANAPNDQAKLVAYSWGQRTGVYDGYFYGTTEATRTAPSGQTNFFQGLSAGTSVGTATGTVTGILGQTLTGTMTYTGTTSLGSTINRTGTVTLLPTGAMSYVWTDTVSGGATGTGTSTQTPGTYFSQTSSGQVASGANLAGNQQVNSNVGDLTGTGTMPGSTSFKAGFSVMNVATNANTFPSSGSHDITIESRGVLGAPDAAGARTGVMTNVTTTNGGTDTTGGLVTVVPATSSTPAATFAQVLGNPTGTNHVTGGVWVQTSDSSGQIVTQAYQGGLTITSSPPHTTGTLNSSGWGFRIESGSGGSALAYATTGNMTGTVTDTGGSTFGSNADIFNQTMAAVVKPDASNNRVGPAVGAGLVSNNAVVSTTGTVTIDPSNNLTHNFNGTWISPDSHGTLTAGTQTLNPGTYFEQTTNPGTGSVTLSNPTTTAPYTQTSTLSATMTRTGVAPASNLMLSGTSITSSTATASAFPAIGTVAANVNIQGVVNSSGSGNMTVTTHQGSNQPVSTYVGPVSIDTVSKTLNGTIVGRNLANPASLNRVSATQTGVVNSGP